MAARLAAAGFITEPGDPRLDVAACSGLGACASASVDARADATRLAPLVAPLAAQGVKLHVSGCAKGCASSQPSAITLVGHQGLYDLVFDGKAQDAPHRSGLTPGAAADFIAAHVASFKQAARP